MANTGYTLIEILVVIGIFSILGTMLVSFLYSGIRTWRVGEGGRQSFERAQVAISEIQKDLSSVYIAEADMAFSPARPVEIRFLCAYREDPLNAGIYKQELCLVRTVPQELRNLLGDEVGNLRDDDADESALRGDGKDNDGDRWVFRNNGVDDDNDGQIDEADEGNLGVDEIGEGTDEEWYNLADDDGDSKVDEDLRPVGDLMQVRYQWIGEELRRGVQAPLAADRDPLDPSRNLQDDPERFSIATTPTTLLINGVLYFGVRLWTPLTSGWDLPLGDGGPEEIWDSTRGLTLGSRSLTVRNGAGEGTCKLFPLDARPLDTRKRRVGSADLEFTYYRMPTGTDARTVYNYISPVLPEGAYDSYFDPTDDVFPRRVQVTLVVTSTRGQRRSSVLRSDLPTTSGEVIDVDDTAVFTGDTHPYVKIGHEWIRYSHIKDKHTLVVGAAGRGARGTVAANHKAGDEVLTGSTFVLTLDLPACREALE